MHPDRFRKFNGVLRYSEGDRRNGWSVTAMGYDGRWNATDQIPRRAVEDGSPIMDKATGFAVDYGWLKVDAFDAAGKPQHQRGVSSEAGIYFLGLPWQSRRGSSFIWGVWHDAKHVAGHIATQRTYLAYRDSNARQLAD